jgi:hypothetical protein
VDELSERRVRTEAGWIGVDISRSRVRTPGRAGYGLYRVRTAAERHWHVPHPVVTPAGEWTAYAFTLDEIARSVGEAIGYGTPAGPRDMVLNRSNPQHGERPAAIVATRWTSAYRGARTGGLADEAGAWRVIADAGLQPVPVESEGLDIALLSHSAGISSPRAETLGSPRQRQREANGEFQREHAEARRVGLERRHAGKLARNRGENPPR